ncbi:MAG TPA: tetratricopeptide repeat protein [Xanthobacteraceae bacterium]|nr:tetratricopeptide repeat protein [Xanthobacteraceae bacterium]
MRFVAFVAAMIVVACATAAPAASDDLARLYARVLKNPADSAASLEYARLAEEQGKLRWALAAYERVAANDPANDEAQRGLARVRRKLQPNVTLFVAEIGGAFESNPRYTNNNPSNLTTPRGELQGFGSLQMRDERSLGDLRWRTNALATGLVHQNEGDLDYGYAGATTGPVLDFFQASTLHIGLGGGASALKHRLFYSEAVAVATIEKDLFGALQTLQLRTGYRDYGDMFPVTHGFYADARAKLSFPDAFQDGNLAVVMPWVRWSGVGGTATSFLLNEIQPGAYIEYGVRGELVRPIIDGVVFGPTVTAFARDYRGDRVPGSTEKVKDLIAGPGAVLWLPNLFTDWRGVQTALKIEYQYYRGNSNDPTRTFNDHIVASSLVMRF